jgi:gamma-glutamyltranspeptidase / glutathione hydrolase
MAKRQVVFFVFLLVFSFSCVVKAPFTQYQSNKSTVADQGMVVTPHPLASKVGLDVLKQGGNAIDAAVAIQFAIAVVYPRAGNLGGGGLMVLRTAKGETNALDYREKAPGLASRDMYLDAKGNVVQGLSTEGHLAAGVPGTVAGMIAAHQKYGKLPFNKLIQPAIDLAERGYAISKGEADRLNGNRTVLMKYNKDANPYLKVAAATETDPKWAPGDILLQKDLAATLKRIKSQGHAGFYEGETAALITAEMQRGKGLISLEDLKNYQAKWREPVSAKYKDFKIISMPPPSSGGIILLQLFKMMERYPLASYGFQSPQAIHLMAEAERRVYADRAQYMGDSDFYKVPKDSLLNDKYLQMRMKNFNPQQATASKDILAGNFGLAKESFETEHTSVVDAMGNAVAVTTTLNSNFGNKVVVHGAGFLLNNEMDDFSAKAGVPNQFGLIGNEANAIAPNKRMLSAMTPTIVEKNGQVYMVIGAPGGSTIITAVFQVMINAMEFNLPLDEAVKAGRFHQQWMPDEIWVEKGALAPETRAALEKMGHKFREINYMAVVKAIQRLPNGKWHGAADPRNPDDDALGY